MVESESARRVALVIPVIDEGATIATESERWFAAKGVRSPERITATLAPGKYHGTI